MSPEQASASPRLDGRTDQYSLACVLYEMLAGEPSYTGTTAQAIIAKRIAEPVPHLSTLRSVPQPVEATARRALAKAPADRFPTTMEFAAALSKTPPQRVLTGRMAALLAGGAMLLALSLLAFLLRPVDAASMTSRQFTFTGKATLPALSPDGQRVAYVSGNRSLVVQRIDGGDPLVLVPPTRWALGPRWSTDGRALVLPMMRDSAELAATWMVPSDGGAARGAARAARSGGAGKEAWVCAGASTVPRS